MSLQEAAERLSEHALPEAATPSSENPTRSVPPEKENGAVPLNLRSKFPIKTSPKPTHCRSDTFVHMEESSTLPDVHVDAFTSAASAK